MMLRSPALTALAVFFISLVVLVVAVDSIGVNTAVYLPGQPTATPVIPTATPTPEPSAARWLEVAPNQYRYAAADLENPPTVRVSEAPMSDFLANSGLEPPPEDAPFPLLNMMEQLRTLLGESIAEDNVKLATDGIAKPVIELIGDVPVATMRIQIAPQTTAQGAEFPGGELFYAWFERGEDIVRIELTYQGPPNAQMQRDLRAWLEQKVAQLAAAGQPETGDEPTGDDASTAPETDDATGQETETPDDTGAEDTGAEAESGN